MRRRVNYAGLDVEELGSVYESLLDFHPQVSLESRSFELVSGSERKQTGSYYTPPELVRELINSALVPVIEDRLEGLDSQEDKEAALLEMKVCDPASGSGHSSAISGLSGPRPRRVFGVRCTISWRLFGCSLGVL